LYSPHAFLWFGSFNFLLDVQGNRVFLSPGTVRDYEAAAIVKSVKGKEMEVELLEDKSTEMVKMDQKYFKRMGTSSIEGVDDMIQLQDLHDGSLLYNIALR
jgi:myosin heavy subunit